MAPRYQTSGNTPTGRKGDLSSMEDTTPKIVYWHRELPPLEAEIMGEHTLEATSARIEGTLAHRDELWDRCYRDLMNNARVRLEQEVERLGGHYAHILDELVDARRDDVTGQAWLSGRYTYVLYRRPSAKT
jgi:hypothetical protein